MIVLLLAFGSGVLFMNALTAPAAAADCRVNPFRFFTAQNDAVATTGVITGGSPCVHNFRAGSTTQFTSASIVSRPANGTLEQRP